nr:MAG TPA: hypothetical protein [Caudoviricetes sp.]
MDNWMHEAEKSHNNRAFAGYEEYKQRVKDLKVTPLVLPYYVQQEVGKELDKALDFKPDGWDVYLQMYTERVPLKGIRSKFEVFGLDEKGTRYPVYQSDYFDVTPCFSHPELQNTWFSFKWYPRGVHAGGVVNMGELYTESRVGSRLPTRHVLVPGGYTLFVPNVPESEQD